MKGIVLFAALNLLILSVAACGRKESPAMGENRLAGEKSPYLLQHAKNPVHWYPWGKEAFERARKEDKPIFLSIGYSTCHWCHVMAHESFEDPEVARLMNEAFVNIKVDREERPDIDGIYMKFCLMMTGSGGWPLTIVMTPDKKAFFAGTYFPKRSVPGRIGMMDLVPRLRDLWRTRKEEICASAEEVLSVAKRSADFTPGEGLAVSDLKRATRQLAARFDEKRGGFGTAPKFPSPHHLLFLLRYWKRTGDSQALHMVERTLQAMGRGGIWDHVGFGFHRYATDADWRVPHFEKMLYDQAGLAMAYTEAFQATQKPAYARTAKEILTYVLRDLKSPEGGFYSAEDADSEGEEGKFYLWKRDEIVALLGKEEGEWVSKALSVREDGNFAEEATGRKTGANILFLSPSPSDAEREAGGMDLPFEERLEAARRRLYEARERRVHPFKDTKILTDWNGLMIAALAKASQAFGKEEYAKAARDAATFILQTLRGPDGRLLHRYRDGEAGLPAHVDDYAFLIWGLIELAEATFETRFLREALDLNRLLLDHFWDEEEGGFFFTADDEAELLLRDKEVYDGAVPSGNSVALWNLMRLAKLTGNAGLREKGEALERAFSTHVRRVPMGYTQFLIGVDFALGPTFEVVIAGSPKAEDTRAMVKALQRGFHPRKVVLLRSEEGGELASLAPFTKLQIPVDGRATAYVCRDFQCTLPTTDIGEMLERLEEK
ncbi:MAG: thioredoxin domain-containing protein [Planctomycetota bacterium]|jgi:uncharacterized protein YyaL (SSP411 family)